MAAVTLQEAASVIYDRLHVYWLIAGQIDARVATFVAVLPTFPDNSPNGRPIANWLTILMALRATSYTPDASTTRIEISVVTATAVLIYKTCWIADYLEGEGLITSAQAVALLAAFNAAFF